jgi:hypothetical protein
LTRCEECELTKLEDSMESRNGVLLRSALDLDFYRHAGFVLTLDDVTAEETRALKTLRFERDRYESDKRG